MLLVASTSKAAPKDDTSLKKSGMWWYSSLLKTTDTRRVEDSTWTKRETASVEYCHLLNGPEARKPRPPH